MTTTATVSPPDRDPETPERTGDPGTRKSAGVENPTMKAARRLTDAANAARENGSSAELFGILAGDDTTAPQDRSTEVAVGALAREIKAREPDLIRWIRPAAWLDRAADDDDADVAGTLKRAAQRIADWR